MAVTDTEASPAERVRALCATRGEASVAAGCAEISEAARGRTGN